MKRQLTLKSWANAAVFGAIILTGCNAAETAVTPEVPSAPVATESVQQPIAPDAPLLPAARLEDIDFNAYSTEHAHDVGLVMGDSRIDAIDKIRLYFAPERGDQVVNLTSSTFERDDGSVLLFSRNNMADDALFAEEVYAVFSGPGGDVKFKQKLAAYGVRFKCRRGDTPMEWTADLCP